MKITMHDGSIAEVSVEEFVALADVMGWKAAPVEPEPPKTHAELLRAALDESTVAAVAEVINSSAEPNIVKMAKEKYPEAFEGEVLPDPPAKVIMPVDKPLPAKITPTPPVFVTQGWKMVIDCLRHFPAGLTTQELAEKLRWTHELASGRMSRLMQAEAVFDRKIVEKVPHTRKFRVTAFGLTCRYIVDGRPGFRRGEREPDKAYA